MRVVPQQHVPTKVEADAEVKAAGERPSVTCEGAALGDETASDGVAPTVGPVSDPLPAPARAGGSAEIDEQLTSTASHRVTATTEHARGRGRVLPFDLRTRSRHEEAQL